MWTTQISILLSVLHASAASSPLSETQTSGCSVVDDTNLLQKIDPDRISVNTPLTEDTKALSLSQQHQTGEQSAGALDDMNQRYEHMLREVVAGVPKELPTDSMLDPIIDQFTVFKAELVGQQAHHQSLVTAALGAVTACNTNKATAFSESGGVTPLETAVDSTRKSHSKCRASETTAGADAEASCKLFEDKQGTTCPLSAAWVKDNSASLGLLATDCVAKEAALTQTSSTCDTDQAQFEDDFCVWSSTLKSVCSALQVCHSEALSERTLIVEEVEELESSHKRMHVAYEKALCFLNLLKTAKSANLTSTHIDTCADLSPDTSNLAVTYSDAPPAATCSTVAITHQPGDAEWRTTEYVGMAAAQLEPTLACPAAPAETTPSPPEAASGSATGGDVSSITISGKQYTVHKLTAGTTDFVVQGNLVADIFMIGGGGGTGVSTYHNGGGGAGGAVLAQSYTVAPGSYSITVAAGGTGGTGTAGQPGTNGRDTTGFSWTAQGGGKGASYTSHNVNTKNCIQAGCAAKGGCGGGGGGNASPKSGASSTQSSVVVPAGVETFGNDGGTTTVGDGTGAGGGGIGAAAEDNGNNNDYKGSVGGTGKDLSSLFGTGFGDEGWFGGGGGGCSYSAGVITPGGKGGGGDGTFVAGGDGVDGTGGGAGGGERGISTNGAKGGSGIVLIRYEAASTTASTTVVIPLTDSNIVRTTHETGKLAERVVFEADGTMSTRWVSGWGVWAQKWAEIADITDLNSEWTIQIDATAKSGGYCTFYHNVDTVAKNWGDGGTTGEHGSWNLNVFRGDLQLGSNWGTEWTYTKCGDTTGKCKLQDHGNPLGNAVSNGGLTGGILSFRWQRLASGKLNFKFFSGAPGAAEGDTLGVEAETKEAVTFNNGANYVPINMYCQYNECSIKSVRRIA